MEILRYFFSSLIALTAVASVSGTCNISLQNDLPKRNDPVYLTKDEAGLLQLALPVPNVGSILLSNKQELFLACTGSKNALIANNKPLANSTCTSDITLNVDGTDYNSYDLNCSSRAAASVSITQISCVDQNSVIIQLGYPIDNRFFTLVNSCHDINGANSRYSSHVLYGSRLAGKVNLNTRPGFSRGDSRLYSGFDPDQAYTQKSQQNEFMKIYGNISTNYIVPSKYYLSRGHLSPDADFLYGTWQYLTYFFVNVAPQWQTINAGNWLTVENNARRIAMNLKVDMVDITGTNGVLRLADDSGAMKPAYLYGDRLPVPNLTWKLLQNTNDSSCIVFIAVNNVHLSSPPATVCPDICSANGWPVLQSDYTKGYIYCCDYASFKAAVVEAPPVTCQSVLKNQ